MILHHGDMWSVWNKADLFVFTANSTITAKGHLVMGAGMAKQVLQRFPGVDKVLGDRAIELGEPTAQGLRYNLLLSKEWPQRRELKLAALQTKYHFSADADQWLIAESTALLCFQLISRERYHAHMNFPGIGAGRLTPPQIVPTVWGVAKDFDNLHLWVKDAQTFNAIQTIISDLNQKRKGRR